jgi:flagellar hook-length control protein FliK
MRNVGQSSEIRLTLVPDSLGHVSVKLVVDAGSVTAHMVADTPEVRDALVAAQPQLAWISTARV